MSSVVNQKAYLQKYLAGPSGDKKKKKKKVAKGKGLQIIDDDLDLSKLRPLEGDELDIYDEGEDAPQIAGIIDERPEDIKKQEQFKTSTKWKVVNQDDGFNSRLKIEEVKKDIKETEKENEIIFGKMYSDSEDEKKKDSDASPLRKHNNVETKQVSKKHNSDSDFSPPRRKERKSPDKNKNSNKNYDSDLSPPRKKTEKRRLGSDSDLSPPRKNESKNRERKKPSRWNTEDTKDKINNRKSPSSDLSPPRKKKNEEFKRSSKVNDSRPNISPRGRSTESRHEKNKQYQHSRNGKDSRERDSSDSDLSPPRKNRRNSPSSPHKKRKSPRKSTNRNDSDSDMSPPRKDRRKERDRYRNSSPPSNKKIEKTLEGKMAGLQDAKQLRKENYDFKKREEEMFSKMTDDVSGRNAQVVSRKGKRETSEERMKQKEKADRQKLIDEKYKKWSKGLKQVEAQEERLQEFMHEASKPLARHKDDRDLEHRLKKVERAGDPMLQYIRERKREQGELPPERPTYKGNYPPNRFGIRPGHRWDGVDRSNGYEKKYFEHQSKRKAQEEEAYKWSTEDL